MCTRWRHYALPFARSVAFIRYVYVVSKLTDVPFNKYACLLIQKMSKLIFFAFDTPKWHIRVCDILNWWKEKQRQFESWRISRNKSKSWKELLNFFWESILICMFFVIAVTGGQGLGAYCPHGQVGICGGYTNQPCPPGSYCRWVPNSDYGLCCRYPFYGWRKSE